MREDNLNACDHCNHGDHTTCERWYRDVCQCDHSWMARNKVAEETP